LLSGHKPPPEELRAGRAVERQMPPSLERQSRIAYVRKALRSCRDGSRYPRLANGATPTVDRQQLWAGLRRHQI